MVHTEALPVGRVTVTSSLNQAIIVDCEDYYNVVIMDNATIISEEGHGK